MNKFLIIVVALVLMGSPTFIYLYKEHPVMLKVVAGSARVLTSRVEADIRMDNLKQSGAHCLQMSSSFDGRQVDWLVLWIPDASSPYGREILIVDRANRNVGIPNSSNLQYHLLWNRFLFQSESGSFYVPLYSAKSYAQDPELVLNDHSISFRMPDQAVFFAGKRIEIIF